MVVVERLAVVIGHEDRALQRFEQRAAADVRVGVVDEHARIDVAVGVDVQVAAAAGDASADILAVVLEVHGEDRLGRADFADAVIHVLALLRVRQELRRGVVADRHIVEIPDEARAEAADEVDIRIGGDGINVRAGVAGGNAERQMLGLKQLHGVGRLFKHAVAAAAVGRGLEALEADGRNEVLHAEHFVGKFLVDERAVGEGEELAVGVLVADGDQILLANERLAAGVDVHVYAELLALRDDGINLVKRQIQPVAVFRRPAAGAVQVAGGGRIQQDRPRDVAVVLLAVFLLLRPADDVGVEEEVHERRLEHFRIGILHDVHDEMVHVVVFIVNDLADSCALSREAVRAVARELIHPSHQLRGVFLRVLADIAERGGESSFFHRICDTHKTHSFVVVAQVYS